MRIKPTHHQANLGLVTKLTVMTLASAVAGGCTGNISTPSPPTPGGAAMPCPVLPATLNVPITPGMCAGVRLANVALACGGAGNVPFSLSTTPGGATLIDATLANGSVVTTTATPVDGRCFDGISVNIGITVGLRYTAEQGQETSGPTSGAACIVRSRADFTQYVTNDPLLIHPGVEDLLKGEIHKILDTQIVPARCVRWRPL